MTIRVMSFNLRNSAARDGVHAWRNRRAALVQTVAAFAPDVLGTQEAMADQIAFLAGALGAYDVVHQTRDGRADGESCAIFYRRARFTPVEAGHFWLSETPEILASQSWNSSLPRMCTWSRGRIDGATVTVFNTHLDHRSPLARANGAALIAARARLEREQSEVIVLGDFNAAPGAEPYGRLVATGLVDTYAAIHGADPEASTVRDFHSDWRGPRIDWIFASPALVIDDAAVVVEEDPERPPSDHRPVTAELTVVPST